MTPVLTCLATQTGDPAVTDAPDVTARTAVIASDPVPIAFTGTNLSLNVLGQQITFPTVTVEPQLDGTVSITGLEGTTVSLAGGIIDASIQAGPGPDAVPAEIVIGLDGIAAQFAVDVHVNTPNVTLGGTFALDIDTTIATPHVQVTADNVIIGLDGPDISADLVIRTGQNSFGQDVLVIDASDVSLALSVDDDPAPLVSVSDGSGTFVLDDAGLAGTAAGTLATNIDDLSLAGTGRIAFNTSEAAVDVSVDGITLALPGGPFARIEVLGATATLATSVGVVALGGDFLFQQGLDDQTVLAVDNLFVTFGGQGIQGGSGAFLITPDAVVGMVSGRASVETEGVAIGGSVGVRVNTRPATEPAPAVIPIITLNGTVFHARYCERHLRILRHHRS